MKPAQFDYARPKTVEEACGILAADMDARVLAGGQTLVPMLAMRLSRPSVLVDITRIAGLQGIACSDDTVEIGAVTRQAAALASEVIRAEVPLLAKALRHVGHPPTRCRGTVGGSVAHGDPSAEIPLAVTVLGAEIVFVGEDGEEERFAPEDFFIGPMLTTAPMGGLLTRLVFPRRAAAPTGTGFREVASRRSDYAFASAGAQVVLNADGTCAEARLGIGSVGDTPVAVDISGLSGTRLTAQDIRGAVVEALSDLETVDDLHATASYRKRAAVRLAELALAEARDDALEQAG
ncbi:FAD binding domain-containing protein [Roseibacterium sp. SDUM158016]|uniref:FAD binding domain-containing protein n=1 Tax=Roseicyclus sediminis TaxID=2980997 RepID=UPI0021D1E8A7|nr:FAD binding domain-containing protein [Roseibacterium sp. SDUM158016]MCU4652023.1 FAD binding domain-containing protein [Roseibacterium sp. SDUM158016]